MPKIRSIESITKKWTEVTPQRAGEYLLGVQDPKEDWKTKTQAAVPNYKAAMTISLTQDRFAKGVGKASTEKWKAKIIAKGGNRFSEGVSLAGPDYNEGFGPFRNIIAATTLPPRYPKGDPRNIDRVRVMADALHKGKVG